MKKDSFRTHARHRSRQSLIVALDIFKQRLNQFENTSLVLASDNREIPTLKKEILDLHFRNDQQVAGPRKPWRAP